MCLIMHREEGDTPVSKEFFKDVWTRNNDGWGIAWVEATTGIVRVSKGMKFKKFWQVYRNLETRNVGMMIHFRFRTKGNISLNMCHPYTVSEEKQIYMFHNGTLDLPTPLTEKENNKSDSMAFVEQVIRPMVQMAENPYQLIRSKAFIALLEKWCGYNNRLAFIDPQGITKINSKIWSETDFGMCVSNNYAYNRNNPNPRTKAVTTTVNNGYYTGYVWKTWGNSRSNEEINRANEAYRAWQKHYDKEEEERKTSIVKNNVVTVAPKKDKIITPTKNDIETFGGDGGIDVVMEYLRDCDIDPDYEYIPYPEYINDMKAILGGMSNYGKDIYSDMEKLYAHFNMKPYEMYSFETSYPELYKEFEDYIMDIDAGILRYAI